MRPIPRFRYIEVPLNNISAQTFYFDTDATLQGAAKILGIEAYTVDNTQKSPITSKSLIADTVFYNSYLTLVTEKDDNEVISNLPFVDLLRSYNYGNILEFEIPKLNITKCYIRVPQGTAGMVVGNVFLLGFVYATHEDLNRIHPAHQAVLQHHR